MTGAGLPVNVADRIYDVLVEHVGARESNRDYFVHIESSGHVTGCRFGGSLGFGGKFWRNTALRPDGRARRTHVGHPRRVRQAVP